MRIAIICVHYPPLRSSCAVQMRDLSRDLLALGHEPIVITPSDGLAKSHLVESIDGIRVFRLKSFATMDISNSRRGINEVLMSLSNPYRIWKSEFPVSDIDAIVWYSPSIFFGPLVHYLKRTSKCPSYLILRDIFPEWTLDLGILKRGPIYYLFKAFAKYQYSVADVIGVQTSSNLKYLENWEKKPRRKLEVLNNWLSAPTMKKSSIPSSHPKLMGRKIFVYIGNMGVAQGMDIFIDLAEMLKSREDLVFLFVGRGTEVGRLQQSVVKKALKNVAFHDEIDSDEIFDLLGMCHVGLIALDPRHKSHNIPGKFLTYLQAGTPVLAKINPGTDLGLIIKKEDVGRVYTGNKACELKKIAEEFIDDEQMLQKQSIKGRSLSLSMFSSGRAAAQVINSISKVK